MSYSLGIDVGGTFTDLALYNLEDGHLEFGKTPSIPADPTLAVRNGIDQLMNRVAKRAEDVEFFIHGTTVAINTLLEHKGVRTGLITTYGFRDVLQIGRQDRPVLYDWRARRAEPLVPRHLRFEIVERMLHTGEILVPLDVKSLEQIIDRLAQSEVDAIAVCLLHSYANPSHEKLIGDAIVSALPNVMVSLSSEVLPEFKEFDRMSTTTINAYVGPGTASYLGALRDRVIESGLNSDVHIMQSNGGVTGAETAAKRPVQTILSGPAAGVIGGVELAVQAGFPNAITVDMGGTSFDISLSYEGDVRHTQESEIEGFPIKVPMVDIHTLGAGGGSIAWIDTGGGLRVGPKSAGANPGPACYGNGGIDPTVTDANLVLGRLSPTAFLGGEITLDIDLARRSIEKCIANPLSLGLEEAAEGIIRVVNSMMLKGIRVVSVARGYDPREFCMVAFGGAGPVHVSELARDLDIPNVLVPIAPGVTSALGLLMADMRHDYVRTVLRLAKEWDPKELNNRYLEMETEAFAQMTREGVDRKNVTLHRVMDARYLGQGFELEVQVNNGDLGSQDIFDLIERFHQAHRTRYGYESHDNPVEIVNLRVVALANLQRPKLQKSLLDGTLNPVVAKTGSRDVYFAGSMEFTTVYNRVHLRPGDKIAGPAIIEQLDSTTLVWPNQITRVDEFSNLVLGHKE